MADKIFLQDDEISTKNIKKAVSLLETVTRSSDSLFAATSLYDIASTMQHNVRNSYGVRFLSNAAEEAESIACELEAVAANLASLQKRLTDCPEALQEADKTFKGWNDKSGEHWLSRTFSTLFGTTIGWYLCDLFGIPRNAPVETVVSSGDETHEQTVPSKENSQNKDTKIIISDYAAGDDAVKGTIRWVHQGEDKAVEYGWGDREEREKKGIDIGVQCNSACESMALSYIGIDRSAISMVPIVDDLGGLEVASYGTKVRFWEAPDGSTIQIDNYANCCDMADIDARIAAFQADGNAGNTAPVMVRYANGANGHWILITGKNTDGTYNIIGPQYGEKTLTVSIDQYGNISGVDGLSHNGGHIVRYAQYSRTGA